MKKFQFQENFCHFCEDFKDISGVRSGSDGFLKKYIRKKDGNDNLSKCLNLWDFYIRQFKLKNIVYDSENIL